MIGSGLVPGDHDTGSHGDAALGERADDHVGHVLVTTGKDLRQGLQERDPHTEIGEQGGELATDGAASDHRRRAGQAPQVQELVGGEDVTAVDLEAGEGSRDRARGEHDVARRARWSAKRPRP